MGQSEESEMTGPPPGTVESNRAEDVMIRDSFANAKIHVFQSQLPAAATETNLQRKSLGGAEAAVYTKTGGPSPMMLQSDYKDTGTTAIAKLNTDHLDNHREVNQYLVRNQEEAEKLS